MFKCLLQWDPKMNACVPCFSIGMRHSVHWYIMGAFLTKPEINNLPFIPIDTWYCYRLVHSARFKQACVASYHTQLSMFIHVCRAGDEPCAPCGLWNSLLLQGESQTLPNAPQLPPALHPRARRGSVPGQANRSILQASQPIILRGTTSALRWGPVFL